MNFLVISLFFTVFFVDLLTEKLGLVSRYFVLAPELLSGIALLIALARSTTGRPWRIGPAYVLFVASLLLVLAMGAVAQAVPSGAALAGLREHLRFLPFFLLPAVYDFSARQLKSQLIVLMALLSIQLPVAFYQRFFQFADRMHTGDVVSGTTNASGALSLVLICGVAAAVVLYLRRKLSLPGFLVLAGLFLAPTTLNETKASLVLLPLAVIGPLLFMRSRERSIRRLAPVLAIGSAGIVAFIGVYDYFIQYRADVKVRAPTIAEFLSEGDVERYLYRGTADGATLIGRFDSIELAVESVTEGMMSAAFGFGPGNVSPAFLPGFEGEYSHYFDAYGVGMTQVSQVLWELGFAGLIVYGLLYCLLFRDARYLARSQSDFAPLGQIWGAIVLIMAAAWLYKAFFPMNAVAFPFWFYAGVVANKAHLLRRQSRHAAVRRQPAAVADPGWTRAPERVPSVTQ